MSRKPFSHLSQVEIRDIVTSFYNGETKLAIAERLNIDHSTVHYHIRKHTGSYPEQHNVYSVIKVNLRPVCSHPSLKCFLCGLAQDELRRRERQTIQELTEKLNRATALLERNGLCVE